MRERESTGEVAEDWGAVSAVVAVAQGAITHTVTGVAGVQIPAKELGGPMSTLWGACARTELR